MGLESGITHVGELDPTWPLGADVTSSGDDHIRMLKTVLQTSFQMHMGLIAPLNPFACMLWADTTTGLLKRRNTANTAWNTIATLDVDFVAASQAEAVAGIENTKYMTALRVAQAIAAQAPVTIPSGTVMAFFQAAAPTGWTQVVTYDDYLLRVVNTAGGGNGGSASPIAGPTITGSHVLTQAELPAHTHMQGMGARADGLGNDGWAGTNVVYPTSAGGVDTPTSSIGSGAGHTHTIAWTPKYLDMILCSKD